MEDVWLMEDEDYNPITWGIAATPTAAVQFLRAKFPSPPYVVRWDEPDAEDPERWLLTGHFEAVPGKSTQHKAVFSIRRFQLVAEAVTS